MERKKSISRVEVGREGAISQGVPRRISHCCWKGVIDESGGAWSLELQGEDEDEDED